MNCYNLPSVTIPNRVTTIKNSAFANCHGLRNLALGTNVTSLGDSAFNQCAMTSVTIPGSVTNIGGGAFGSCGSLLAITVDSANLFYSSANGVLFNQDQTTLVQYPSGLDGSYAIPPSVTNIAADAFDGCTGLTGVTIPDSVTVIGSGAFSSCTALAGITIDTNVTSIDGYTFWGCTGLTSFTIPDSILTIGDYAFFGCSGLTNVIFGTNVTSIANYAFFGCSGLTSITIPDSIVALQDWTFYGCTSLTRVTMSSHLATIFGMTFPSCPSLTGIYFQGDAPNIDPYAYSSYSLAPGSGATVYYLPWTTGWPTPGTLFGGLPTALWLPQAQTSDASFGVQTNQFGFNITWANDTVVVVEACTDLANPDWTPVGTNTLTGGSSYFSDSQWTNYPTRFYRLRSP